MSSRILFDVAGDEGVTVQEDAGVVAQKLAAAPPWPHFTDARGAEVYVNPVFVRLVRAS